MKSLDQMVTFIFQYSDGSFLLAGVDSGRTENVGQNVVSYIGNRF